MKLYKRYFKEAITKPFEHFIVIGNSENRHAVIIKYLFKEDALMIENIYQKHIGKNYDLYLSLKISFYHIYTDNIKKDLLLRDIKPIKFIKEVKIKNFNDIIKIRNTL